MRALVNHKAACRIIVGVLAIGLVAGTTAVFLAGSQLSEPARAKIGAPPQDFPAESIQIHSESGSDLQCWFVRGSEKCGGVVLLHPLHANRLAMLGRAEFLWRAGYSVLLFDFQAHGESPGDQITFGYLESRDARAAVNYLKERLPGAPVAVIGCSLGAAAAVLGDKPLGAKAVVLEAMYPTIENAVQNRLRMRTGPLGRPLSLLLLLQIRPRLGITTDDLRPIAYISDLGAPVLIIAGTKDQHTTIEESQQIFEQAAPPKEFWAIEGAMHVDFHRFTREAYEKRILEFLGKYVSP